VRKKYKKSYERKYLTDFFDKFNIKYSRNSSTKKLRNLFIHYCNFPIEPFSTLEKGLTSRRSIGISRKKYKEKEKYCFYNKNRSKKRDMFPSDVELPIYPDKIFDVLFDLYFFIDYSNRFSSDVLASSGVSKAVGDEKVSKCFDRIIDRYKDNKDLLLSIFSNRVVRDIKEPELRKYLDICGGLESIIKYNVDMNVKWDEARFLYMDHYFEFFSSISSEGLSFEFLDSLYNSYVNYFNTIKKQDVKLYTHLYDFFDIFKLFKGCIGVERTIPYVFNFINVLKDINMEDYAFFDYVKYIISRFMSSFDFFNKEDVKGLTVMFERLDKDIILHLNIPFIESIISSLENELYDLHVESGGVANFIWSKDNSYLSGLRNEKFSSILISLKNFYESNKEVILNSILDEYLSYDNIQSYLVYFPLTIEDIFTIYNKNSEVITEWVLKGLEYHPLLSDDTMEWLSTQKDLFLTMKALEEL
jgi:hypothetical protein